MKRRVLVCLAGLVFVTTSTQGQEPQPIARELPAGVEVIRDITYATYGERNLSLDLYLPAERSADPLPVIVVIRGGGWRRGDKNGFGPMAAALAKRGLAATCIEYRTSREALFPAAVEDTKAAVRWLRANGAQHGINPEAIGAIGGSAGAHLAVYLGVTSDKAKLEGQGGNQGFSSAISTVVAFATPASFDVSTARREGDPLEAFLGSNDPDIWQYASPITHVSESSPPALLMHSESDRTVPFNQSLKLAARYADHGVPVEIVLISNAPHAFWNYTEWFGRSMDRAAAFFWRHLRAGR